MAWPSISTRSMSGWIFRIFSIFSGVRERDTREAILSPTLRSRPLRALPILATWPMNMPPEPVTGFCILPRCSTISRILASIFLTSWPTASSICVKLAESMLRAITSTRISLS